MDEDMKKVHHKLLQDAFMSMPLKEFMKFFQLCKGSISYNQLFKYYGCDIPRMRHFNSEPHILQGTVEEKKWTDYYEGMDQEWGNVDTNHRFNYCFDWENYYVRKGRRKRLNSPKYPYETFEDILPICRSSYAELQYWITEVLDIPKIEQDKLNEFKSTGISCESETHTDMIQHLNNYKVPLYVQPICVQFVFNLCANLYSIYLV